MMIRTAILSDASDIANIHKNAFKGFFLTSLGISFLKTYYKACIQSQESLVLVAIDDSFNQPIGFASGCYYSKGFHKRLLASNLFSFLLSIGIGFVKRPSYLIRLIKNLDKKSSINDEDQYGELLSIGVLPEYNGKGIGKELLSEFEKYMKDRLITKLTLTTDVEDNEGVFAFYLNNGYHVYSTFITYPHRKMYRFIKEFDEKNI